MRLGFIFSRKLHDSSSARVFVRKANLISSCGIAKKVQEEKNWRNAGGLKPEGPGTDLYWLFPKQESESAAYGYAWA